MVDSKTGILYISKIYIFEVAAKDMFIISPFSTQIGEKIDKNIADKIIAFKTIQPLENHVIINYTQIHMSSYNYMIL